MGNNQTPKNWANKPKPDPSDYGYEFATTPNVGNWTVDGGEQKYYDDLGTWEEAQDDAAFQKQQQELEEGTDEQIVFSDED